MINSLAVRVLMSAVFYNVLGIDNTATGFIGGFTGRFVTDSLDAEGIKTT